ncbi:hypothetical protein [Microvirgula sp. AG722]|uniref:hypothetical protein n=1 Tax=Microvirgula sp. AG722 TaxID=2183901 RepID=UPI000DD623A8|nr:hypothetical protein [Microvirgula sp. AG722]
MSENIASFDDFDSDIQIAAHQTGLVRIVLEGEMDVTLFRRYWFSHRQDVFEFVEAESVAGAAGCTGVRSGVATFCDQGIPAFGIVDRDTHFRQKNWDQLFLRDATSLNPDPIGTRLYVASRWEVEAYLLEADQRLSDWVSAQHRKPPGPEHLCRQAVEIVLQACDSLLSAAAYFASKHEQGEAVSAGAFCDCSDAQIEETCNAHIAASPADAQEVAAKVSNLIAAVRAELPPNEVDRLAFLLQYVDTKRLFKRLVHKLGVQENPWFLATIMMRDQRPPRELDQFLSQVEAQFAC